MTMGDGCLLVQCPCIAVGRAQAGSSCVTYLQLLVVQPLLVVIVGTANYDMYLYCTDYKHCSDYKSTQTKPHKPSHTNEPASIPPCLAR